MKLLIFFVVFEVLPEVYSIFMWSILGAKYFLLHFQIFLLLFNSLAWKNQCPRFNVHPVSFVKKEIYEKNGRVFFLKLFLQSLRFIWLSHRFFFFVDALPIGIWQVLMVPRNRHLAFFQNLRCRWLDHTLQFFVYALPIGIWQVLMDPKNTILDPRTPTLPGFATQPSCICQSLGKTISRIFEQWLSRVGV